MTPVCFVETSQISIGHFAESSTTLPGPDLLGGVQGMPNPPSEMTSGIVMHPLLRKIMDLPLFTLGLFNLQVLAFKPNSSKGTFEKT